MCLASGEEIDKKMLENQHRNNLHPDIEQTTTESTKTLEEPVQKKVAPTH